MRLLAVAIGCLAIGSACATGGHRLGVPRTLEPGDVVHHLSLEAHEAIYSIGCNNWTCGAQETFAFFPTFGILVGIADRVELQASLSASTSFEVRSKVQFIRSPFLDAALVPTIGVIGFTEFDWGSDAENVVTATLPLLVGINLGDVSLVPGAAIGAGRTDSRTHLLWAGSFSAFFRVSSGVAIGPGITVVPDFHELSSDTWRFHGGITVALGDQPAY